MPKTQHTGDTAAALHTLIELDVLHAGEENTLIARDEQKDLHPWTRRWADKLREEGGKGTRVRATELIDRAFWEGMRIWERVNPSRAGRDSAYLSLEEIDAIDALDGELGELTHWARAYAFTHRVGEHASPAAELLREFKRWFEGTDHSGHDFPLDGFEHASRYDAHPGHEDRDRMPADVRDAFDFFHRAELAGRATVAIHKGEVHGHTFWAIWVDTPGEHRYLEVHAADGSSVTGARLLGAEVMWDEFEGRVRLAHLFTTLDAPANEDGLSEDPERAGAGQPLDYWRGDVQITGGLIHHVGALLGPVEWNAELTDAQRRIAVSAVDYLWEVHLRHAADGSGDVVIGEEGQGVMTIGDFRRYHTGETVPTVRWKDIDDGSYVLYLDEAARIRVIQYDN